MCIVCVYIFIYLFIWLILRCCQEPKLLVNDELQKIWQNWPSLSPGLRLMQSVQLQQKQRSVVSDRTAFISDDVSKISVSKFSHCSARLQRPIYHYAQLVITNLFLHWTQQHLEADLL